MSANQNYAFTKAEELSMAQKDVKQAQEMLQYFTMKAAQTERLDEKARYNSFVKIWRDTLKTRETALAELQPIESKPTPTKIRKAL